MESEASAFETSEMVAAFLASTPLLRESWRLCAAANVAAPMGFLTEEPRAGVVYLAFSGVQTPDSVTDPAWAHLVPLPEDVFGPLVGPSEDGRPAMVHAGLLQLFLSMLHSLQAFLNQVLALKEKCKSIVITGHSLGGATASLTTLWLLSQLSQPVLCITFGSPLIGNEPLTHAILRERWAANFCHVAAKHDIVPRLLFAPSATLSPPMRPMLQHWHNNIVTIGNASTDTLLGDEEKAAEFFGFVIASLEKCSLSSGEAVEGGSVFWPFGNYLLCSKEGAVCLDDAASVVKMMYLMLVTGFAPSECIDDHVKYEEYVGIISLQYLQQRSFFAPGESPGNSYDAGLALALQSTGINPQEPAARLAKECLMVARRLGLTPILNCAKLAIHLSKVGPYRAQIEWYIASCDKSDDQLGYYDDFKLKGSSKKVSKVNMFRHNLATFWDGVIEKLEKNELPFDFQKRDKWVNAFHSYKLVVEPLDIAEYYRKEKHLVGGHYLRNGRPRRYQISDKWWRERRNGEKENRPRTTYASQTQDSCFWARLEEAKECLDQLQNNAGSMNLAMWESVNKFDMYARSLVEKKEVSKDVVAKNSSYTKWTEALRKLSSPLVFPEF